MSGLLPLLSTARLVIVSHTGLAVLVTLSSPRKYSPLREVGLNAPLSPHKVTVAVFVAVPITFTKPGTSRLVYWLRSLTA